MKNDIHISKFIFDYRKKHGLTQQAFAERLGVSAMAVSKWERERCYPDLFLLTDLSELLGVSIDEMLGKNPSADP